MEGEPGGDKVGDKASNGTRTGGETFSFVVFAP